MLIHGDNLDALKALLPFYAGRVKCIYIDPPYNTRSAFAHYDDNLEHSQWLAMIYPRLELLRDLLAEDGSIWVSIDDNEGHYLKVVMDEVFGRGNFVATVDLAETTTRAKSSARHLSTDHDYILVYAKNPAVQAGLRNPMPRDEQARQSCTRIPTTTHGDLGSPVDLLGQDIAIQPGHLRRIACPIGRRHCGRHRDVAGKSSRANLQELDSENRIWWGKDGNIGVPTSSDSCLKSSKEWCHRHCGRMKRLAIPKMQRKK